MTCFHHEVVQQHPGTKGRRDADSSPAQPYSKKVAAIGSMADACLTPYRKAQETKMSNAVKFHVPGNSAARRFSRPETRSAVQAGPLSIAIKKLMQELRGCAAALGLGLLASHAAQAQAPTQDWPS